MAMSRKHYERAAMIVRENITERDGSRETAEGIARGLAMMFELDNHSFDRDRFYAACGIEV